MKRVVIVGGGFAGLNAAKRLRGCRDVRVTLVDRNSHHLFQPLLYQVAMAGLSPADIAAPIRSLLSSQENAVVLRAEAQGIELNTSDGCASNGWCPPIGLSTRSLEGRVRPRQGSY